MKRTVSPIVLGLALIGVAAPPIFDGSASAASQPQLPSASVLPEFVPSAGRTKYTLAVEGNKEAATRRAAEALSAKFAETSAGSASTSDDAEGRMSPSIQRTGQAARVGAILQVPEPSTSRSIVLAANEPPNASDLKKSLTDRAKEKAAVRKIPHAVGAKQARARSGIRARETLAVISQKVGFLDRITNPALWP